MLPKDRVVAYCYNSVGISIRGWIRAKLSVSNVKAQSSVTLKATQLRCKLAIRILLVAGSNLTRQNLEDLEPITPSKTKMCVCHCHDTADHE